MQSLNNLEENKGQDYKKDASKVSLPKLGSFSNFPYSVASHYAKYRNTKVNLKRNMINNTVFEVDEKYEIIDVMGQGAYGIVVGAKNKQASKRENAYVAIKKIEKAFEHKIFTKRTLRELKIMRLLRHENIIKIQTLLLPKSREDFKDLYVCTPLMETDLASIIKSSQPLGDEHIKFFIYQILRGVKYLNSAGIVHRDLKPRNLLVNSNCDLKICDFGLSRAINGIDTPGQMTDYVATRWYRAPELLLEKRDYGSEVDVWSVGCILAELLRRKPFLPGSDTKNQIDITFEVFGSPTEDYISQIPKAGFRRYVRSLPFKKPKALEAFFPKASAEALDLLKKMMVVDYRKRISISDALKHPYLAEFHCPEDEPIRDPVPTAEFEFEKYKLSLQQLKDLVYEEILLYHFESFRTEYFRRIKAGECAFKDVIGNANALKPGQVEPGDEYN